MEIAIMEFDNGVVAQPPSRLFAKFVTNKKIKIIKIRFSLSQHQKLLK